MPAYTKPCRNCAKPIRRDATNCYYCGEVFDTVRCVACDHPIKIGSPACQICGEDAPPPPPPPVARRTEGPPKAKRTGEQECPECREFVPLAAVVCKYCGEPLNSPTREQKREMGWGEGKDYAPHRGGRLLTFALLSLICFPVVVAPLVVVLAIGDLKKMAAERMDPDGKGLTISALIIAGLITLLIYGTIAAVFIRIRGWA